MKDDWSITTGDGGVALYLPSDFGAQIDAHTGDGTIRSELDLTAGNDGQVSRRTVRGPRGRGRQSPENPHRRRRHSPEGQLITSIT